ncbi:hypothetical protein LJB95_00910 [Paludibacteraceae bacterium OttesenSCG-928-F17]|nr:hypothetical protein [Paludibacteraceae bacterium OttesenSCG-928-F17]
MIKTKYHHPTIEICRKCNGTGHTHTFAPDDYREEYPIKQSCELCLGSGRVIVSKKIETKIEAFQIIN